MTIEKGKKARVTNPRKNNLRPLPKIDNLAFLEIEDKTMVSVLDGPVQHLHRGIEIPYWVVRVLEGSYKDRVGWMAESNQSEKTILEAI